MKKGMLAKSLALLLAAALLAVSFTGCGAPAKDSAASTENYSSGAWSEVSVETEEVVSDMEFGSVTMDTAAGTAPSTAISVPQDGRKVILSANVGLEAKEYEAALNALLTKVSTLGGYVSARRDYDYSRREVQLTVRIPSAQFDDFIGGLSGIANVTNLEQKSQDITESYIETESYLASLKTQQERLLELMEKAETLEELLTIEDRLATVRAELQYYASLKNSYDNRISYSTVEVSLYEVRDYTVVQPTFGEELWEVIKDTGEDFVEFLQDLLFFIIAAFPYLALLAAVLIPTVLLTKKHRAKKAARKAASVPPVPPAPSADET